MTVKTSSKVMWMPDMWKVPTLLTLNVAKTRRKKRLLNDVWSQRDLHKGADWTYMVLRLKNHEPRAARGGARPGRSAARAARRRGTPLLPPRRRRLAAEGKSYQGVKDALRRDAAIHLLLNPDLTLEDVAQQVGFSETSTFHRAFKKWTGVTPGLYRQLHGYH